MNNVFSNSSFAVLLDGFGFRFLFCGPLYILHLDLHAPIDLFCE